MTTRYFGLPDPAILAFVCQETINISGLDPAERPLLDSTEDSPAPASVEILIQARRQPGNAASGG